MIFLCYGDPEECPNCGGWTGAWKHGRVMAGGWTPIKSAGRGPFRSDGVAYCSESCADEARRFSERSFRASPSWCYSCGFDNHEHAEGCNGLLTNVPPGG